MVNTMMQKKMNTRHQRGQAYAETVVGFVVIALFLMGAHHLWKYAEIRQQLVDATRFAAWERTVWEPEDNTVEKFALHQTNAALAKNVVMHQFSTPEAWRDFRTTLNSNGTPATRIADRDRGYLKLSTKNFVSAGYDPSNLITVNTSSGWTNSAERAIRGMDPTGRTTTSLELDRDTYKTTTTKFQSQLAPTTSNRLFSFLMTPISATHKLALITNAWAASPPVTYVRVDNQLLPLSVGDKGSGTKANNLAYFGLGANVLVGMAPLWEFVGGRNGLGGQYVVRKIGLSASGANGLIQSSGQDWEFDPSNIASSLLLKAQQQQNESFQPNSVSPWHHRHTFIIDNSDIKKAENDVEEEDGVKLDAARDSSISKRKYKAISLANPVETYFAPSQTANP